MMRALLLGQLFQKLLVLAFLGSFAFAFLSPLPRASPAAATTATLHTPLFQSSRSIPEGAQLDGEEPMSVIFQRAVVLQRSGDYDAAQKEYDMFLKAADQCQDVVNPTMLAEVYNNLGAVYVKQQKSDLAVHHFERAVQYRKIGNAYVNLALLALQKGSQSMDPAVGVAALNEAKGHCVIALQLNDDPRAVATAEKLLGDIEGMLQKATGGGGS
jgi:tetratricopeptide (TPR) repeat protein